MALIPRKDVDEDWLWMIWQKFCLVKNFGSLPAARSTLLYSFISFVRRMSPSNGINLLCSPRGSRNRKTFVTFSAQRWKTAFLAFIRPIWPWVKCLPIQWVAMKKTGILMNFFGERNSFNFVSFLTICWPIFWNHSLIVLI